MSGDVLEDSRRRLEHVLAAGGVAVVAALASAARSLAPHVQGALAANVALATLGYVATTSMIQSFGDMFIKANLRGIDLLKRTTKRDPSGNLVRPIEGVAIPESQGTIAATAFILVLSIFIPFVFAGYDLQRFPHAHLAEYLAALLTITVATFMGFADDVLDLRWRHKIPLPFLATLPLLLVYYADGGKTGVMVPNPLRGLFGHYVELGVLFYVFLLMLAVFSTHAINIYAGVNGLEVGQSVVIAVSLVALNIVQLHRIDLVHQDYREQHVQSLFLLIPFLTVSVALLRLNWFPARVFVGDTYCYFAGMTFAASAIVGHYSKTLVLFLVPQVLNFLYSSPQLFRVMGIPCPRHRMPVLVPQTGLVTNSYTEFKPEDLRPLGRAVFWALRTLRLAHFKAPRPDGTIEMSNLTLINFVLYALGPCREDALTVRLLLLQGLCSAMGFMVRFNLASYVFDSVL